MYLLIGKVKYLRADVMCMLIILETYFHWDLIDIFEYQLSAITMILISVISIGQNFHIGAILFLITLWYRCSKYFSIKKIIHVVGIFEMDVMPSGNFFTLSWVLDPRYKIRRIVINCLLTNKCYNTLKVEKNLRH